MKSHFSAIINDTNGYDSEEESESLAPDYDAEVAALARGFDFDLVPVSDEDPESNESKTPRPATPAPVVDTTRVKRLRDSVEEMPKPSAEKENLDTSNETGSDAEDSVESKSSEAGMFARRVRFKMELSKKKTACNFEFDLAKFEMK